MRYFVWLNLAVGFLASGAVRAEEPDAELLKQAVEDACFLRKAEAGSLSEADSERFIKLKHPAVIEARGGVEGMRKGFAFGRKLKNVPVNEIDKVEVVGTPKYYKGSDHEFVIVTVKATKPWLGRTFTDERSYIGARKFGEKNLVYVDWRNFVISRLATYFPDFPEKKYDSLMPKNVLSDGKPPR